MGLLREVHVGFGLGVIATKDMDALDGKDKSGGRIDYLTSLLLLLFQMG